MRWATYTSASNSQPRIGIVVENEVLGLDSPEPLLALLNDPADLRRAGEAAVRNPAERIPIRDVTLLAPIPKPPSIRDFSAFEDHVRTTLAVQGKQMDDVWYEMPIFYFHNPAVLIGSGQSVPIPPDSSAFDFELEVAAIIAGGGQNWTPAVARDHIAGFTILNDWSARDIQSREMRMSLGPAKGKDSADGLGPYLVTSDEFEPFRSGKGYDRVMTARVNGREYARGNLADLYWSFEELVAYASRGTVLRPGDIIGSGTCGSGCILELSLVHGDVEFPWLRSGDVVELEVDGIGVLTNRIADRIDAPPWRLDPS